MPEAPQPMMPVTQLNVSLVKTLEALTGVIENLWNPDAGQPPENLIHAIQESRQTLSQEGGAALNAELDADEPRDLDEDEAEEMSDSSRRHMLQAGRR